MEKISFPPFYQARNSEVRANAAFLFVDAFPVRDPSFTADEMDNEIQKQFEELFVSFNESKMLNMKLLSELAQEKHVDAIRIYGISG